MFFDIYKALCAKKGISVYKAAQDVGCHRSIVAKWKDGSIPNGETLLIMADYFDVSTDCLLGKEKAPSSGERMMSDDDLIFALWGGAADMDAADLADVKAYADFLRQKKQMSGK